MFKLLQGSFSLQFLSKVLDGFRGLFCSFSYGCLSLSAGFLSSFKEAERREGFRHPLTISLFMQLVSAQNAVIYLLLLHKASQTLT